jgi:lipopolysaccharide/colanic/teichoic acid biosynthesis glycosyltransferase
VYQTQLAAPPAEARRFEPAPAVSGLTVRGGNCCAPERRAAETSIQPEIRPALHPGELLREFIDRGLALALLLVSLPLFVPLGLAVLISSGWPVFYCGERLGRHRKPFRMYKFRTLVNGAHRRIGSRMLARGDDLVTPVGWFLRDTRLDELPQLLNIVRGDMRFVGPRPERPEIAASLCAGLTEYASRFEVKPGLVGYSQLFTPHNTPKRIRSLIDSRMANRRTQPLIDLLLVGYTALVVAGLSAVRLVRNARLLIARGRRRYRNQRRLSRVQPRRTAAIVQGDDGTRCRVPVVDINEQSFVMLTGERLVAPLLGSFTLITRVGRNGRSRYFSASCRGRVAQVRPADPGFAYVVAFEPENDRSLYVLHQHILRRSLANGRA